MTEGRVISQALGWAIGLGLLGAIGGSFIATLVLRWPQGRSVVGGRSACDGCGNALGPAELVPLVSWAVQRGRCRACGARIDPAHPAIEALAAATGAAAGWAAPGADGVMGAAFGWLLLALAGLDWRAWWLPDRLTGLLALAGLADVAIGGPPLADRLIGGAGGFGLLWLVAWGYHQARGREGLGGGDPKLFGAIGLWLGWRLLPVVLLLAGLAGLGVLLVRWAGGRPVTRTDALPLGTLLAAAAYPAWLAMVSLSP